MISKSELFKELNQDARRVFNVIQKYGPQTKGELSLKTGMKLTTLLRTMQCLEETGLIVADQVGVSSGGRKPILYNLSVNRFYCIGIDISRLYTQIVFTTLGMAVLYKHQFEMTVQSTPEVIVEKISILLDEMMVENGIDQNQILGIGVGTVGPMNRDKGILLNPHNFLSPGWEQVPLKGMLEKRLKRSVFLENGTNAAVLLESDYGVGRGYKNVAYLNVGIGIRSAVIASGTLIRSINEREDALAHMVIDVDGEKCACGNSGCIEGYATIHAIMRRFAEDPKNHMTSIHKALADLDYVDICQAADSGDDLCRQLIQNAGTYFGIGLINFIQLLSTEMIILSGPLVRNSKLFYEICREVVLSRYPMYQGHLLQFSRGGDFDGTAIAIGSASLVLKKHLENSAEQSQTTEIGTQIDLGNHAN